MSSLNVVRFVNQKQVQAVCRAFLRAHPGQEYDAIQASMAIEREWGILVDHHEFSGALEVLCKAGEAILVQPGGYTKYRMKSTIGYYATTPMFTILEGGAYSAGSENLVVALLFYLYVAGRDGQDTLLDTLDTLLESTQFEIHVGETVFKLDDTTRSWYESAKSEYDKENY